MVTPKFHPTRHSDNLIKTYYFVFYIIYVINIIISFIVLGYSIVELVLLCQFLSTHDKTSYLVFRYLFPINYQFIGITVILSQKASITMTTRHSILLRLLSVHMLAFKVLPFILIYLAVFQTKSTLSIPGVNLAASTYSQHGD